MEETQKKKKVSFSQYSMWTKCPYQYYLNYILGKKIFDANLNTCFGTAIHNVLQLYIGILYTKSVQEADSLELFKMFIEEFKIQVEKAKTDNPKLTFTDDEYTGFQFDGEDILKEFLSTSNRMKHFPANKYEFLGAELPLDASLRNNVEFIAFVDLILKNKENGRIKIIDFKTSSTGWNKYQKEDPTKYEQVLLYKAFYSKKFNVPLNMIDVEFFILKRKLYEGVAFPQSRLQLFTPIHNSPAVATTLNSFSEFINECFKEDGTYNMEGKYPKIPGKAKKNCKYCTHKGINCDAKSDKLED